MQVHLLIDAAALFDDVSDSSKYPEIIEELSSDSGELLWIFGEVVKEAGDKGGMEIEVNVAKALMDKASAELSRKMGASLQDPWDELLGTPTAKRLWQGLPANPQVMYDLMNNFIDPV